MAIVKFIPARKPQSSGGMYGSMEYCKQEHKTWDEVTMRHLITGTNCVESTAYREFMNTKEQEFLFFLNTLVRDYLTVDDPANIAKEDFVDKVESDAA